MNREEVMKYISSDMEIMHGQPCIKGTRIPVGQIPAMIADGMTIKQILKEYPSLTDQSIRAALKYSSYACNFEISKL
jgi:uncharacterized protein (DUF433 family)